MDNMDMGMGMGMDMARYSIAESVREMPHA
jgi:hypothetical protein